MSDALVGSTGGADDFLGLYDVAVDQVYGYLLHRCGHVETAQDLTSETFLAAARNLRDGLAGNMNVAWLIGVARHKLVDHWRRRGREERMLRTIDAPIAEEQWDETLDEGIAVDVLRTLAPHHRSALTLRYVDDLSVREVAHLLGRTEHATEALLVRARTAFRRAYERTEAADD